MKMQDKLDYPNFLKQFNKVVDSLKNKPEYPELREWADTNIRLNSGVGLSAIRANLAIKRTIDIGPSKLLKEFQKSKKDTMQKKTSKSTSKRKSTTVKRASRILTDQKKEYQRMFVRETKRGGDTKNAAKRAGILYRSKFGSTPEIRWKNALKSAKCR